MSARRKVICESTSLGLGARYPFRTPKMQPCETGFLFATNGVVTSRNGGDGYPRFSGCVASDAGDARDVAKHSKHLVDLPPRLDYCNAVVVVDIVCSRVAESVRFVLGPAQRRYPRRTCSQRSLIIQ